MLHIQNTLGLGVFAFTQKRDPFVVGSALTAGAHLLGGITSLFGGNHAADKSLQATRETNKANRELAQYQNEWNLAQWNRQNVYNTPLAQRQRYEEAGINPYFALGNIQAGQAESLNSAEMANQQSGAEAYNHLAQGYRDLGNSISSAGSQYLNAQYQQEQTKAMQLQNTENSLSMLLRVKGLRYSNQAQRMSNELFNANMQSLMNITKNQERESYAKVAQANLQTVGMQYDVAQKRFTNEFILPQQRDIAEMTISQMATQIAYTKAQQRWTEKQTRLAATYAAAAWMSSNASLMQGRAALRNADTNYQDVQNQIWNRNQSTYRENYTFNRAKPALVNTILQGVQQLTYSNMWQQQKFEDSHSMPNRFWRWSGVGSNAVSGVAGFAAGAISKGRGKKPAPAKPNYGYSGYQY